MEVCQPSQANGKGNPTNKVSGASTGSAYHHLVIVANEITVNGITRLIVTFFIHPMLTFVQFHFSWRQLKSEWSIKANR